jgi:hypothetical protein
VGYGVNERLRRLRESDGPLVKFAITQMGLLILGRKRWGTKCPCGDVVAKEEWNRHRCRKKA